MDANTDKIRLSPRERQVVRLAALGFGDKQIGCAMGISDKTATFYIRKVMTRYNCTTRFSLAFVLTKAGLLDDIDVCDNCTYQNHEIETAPPA